MRTARPSLRISDGQNKKRRRWEQIPGGIRFIIEVIPVKKRKGWLWLAAVLLLALLAIIALDQRLAVRHYTVQSDKIDSSVRLAVLSDLHECDYGPGGQRLLDAVAVQEPDAILMPGDMFADHGDFSYGLRVMQELAQRWPCYYVIGNHECWTGQENAILHRVEDCGVSVLHMESETLTVRGQTIRLCGIPDPYYRGHLTTDELLTQAAADGAPGEFSVLLAHRPEMIGKYAQHPFDVVVSGHAHGGQVRIPGILNGLCAPNQGWFPPYAGGEYRVGNTVLIVSRGLSTQAQWYVPRVFNRPELVIVDLE